MKITKLELFTVKPRWLFLKMSTDEGISGWGEPIVEGRASTTKQCVEELGYYLIGKDPRNIEDNFQVLYRGGFYRGGPVLSSAISGLEQAMWDIKGKFYNASVYELLGGKVRDKVQMYCQAGSVEDVLDKKAAGYRAFKLGSLGATGYVDTYRKIDEKLKAIAAIRDAVGYEVDLAIDFHGEVHRPMAKVLAKELEQFKMMFIEEPVLCDNMEAFAEIARHTCIPIATGERMYTRWDYKRLFDQKAVDIVQPDLSHAGGIWECRKIAAMAEAYDMAVAPHCPLGPISLASCLQLDVCTPNAFIQEQALNIHYTEGAEFLTYLRNPEVLKLNDGFVDAPVLPGLGLDVNEEAVRAADATGHDWKNPILRLEDGSFAEW